MIRVKASQVLIHSAAWLLFIATPLLFMTQGQPLINFPSSALLPYLQFCVVYMLIFYFHTSWLIPQYFLKKKYLNYWLSLALMLIIVFFIRPFDALMKLSRPDSGPRPEMTMHRPPPPLPSGQGYQMPPPIPRAEPGFEGDDPGSAMRNEGRHFDITSIFIFVMIIGLGSALQSIRQSQLFEKRAIVAEAEKANAELAFLKAQINPHFLFNTLNNIYTLCITGSEKAAESVMKLSNIMRYVTDESAADFVPLQDEIACIDNFIALQKLRLGKKVTLDYVVTGDPGNHRITPLLMMTFIENAFKFGLSNHLEATIRIGIEILQEKIIFSTENQLFEHKQQQARFGIGIENTKKRLNHLYPDSHTLDIDVKDGFFKVLLILKSK
ncbi:sensor histidine kinase [Pedobacter sp. PWIIR3]